MKEKAIGIDFGGTSVKMGVVCGEEIIEKSEPIPTEQFRSAELLIDAFVAEVQNLCKKYPEISAVGVGVPGFVDHEKGIVRQLTNVPGWVDVPIRNILAENTQLPCIAENDANCMGYAEWKFGAGKGSENMVAVTLGTGVGGALILNGNLFRGSCSGAGEIGQMSINYRGNPGEYRNRGALEEYCGHRQISQRAVELYAEKGIEKSIEECSVRALVSAAVEGDSIAQVAWRKAAEKLACALANITWLINPDTIVIGGGVANAGELLFQPLKDHVKEQVHHAFWENLKILPAYFSNDAGIIGAAHLAMDIA